MSTSKPLQARPVIVGEVLFDCFPDGTEVLGGAPFNVAWHLQGFGRAPLMISRVGDDPRGRQVQEAMQSWGLDTAGLQIDPEYPTGLVNIALEGKQHAFDILADQAYDQVDVGLSQEAIRGVDVGLAYHGTLILRTPKVRQAVDQLLTTADMPVFVDVNLRDPWWRADDLPPLLQRARWVKVNDEELTIIAERVGLASNGMEETAQRFRAAYELDLLIVTLGSQGALAIDSTNTAIRIEPERDTVIVDTVGAGDAFSSVVLFGLLEGWPVPQIMRKAQDFASRVCGQRGATSTERGLYEAMRF